MTTTAFERSSLTPATRPVPVGSGLEPGTRLRRVASGAAVIAAGVVTLAGWAIGFGAHTLVRAGACAVLVAVALTVAGIRVLRMSDQEFATGRKA